MAITAGKDLEGSFTLATEQDGVYLTVKPPQGKGKKVVFGIIERDLIKLNHLGKIDIASVRKAVDDSSGHPVKVIDIKPKPKDTPDAQIFVQVAKDEMSAVITIIPAQPGGKSFTEDDIRMHLATSGVTHGIKDDTIKKILANPPDLEPLELEIAKGTNKLNGEDAKLELLVEIDSEKAAPKPEETDASARVDYRNVTQIQNVKKGDPIARKAPPTPGQPGKTVTGKIIPATPGKDINITGSKGVVKAAEDENLFLADADGQVSYKDKKLQVLSIYEVKADVDFSVGNIEFVGSVIIHGNVKDDFKVHAAGDIIVEGVVEAAQLDAGGKINVKGGVMGRDRCILKAKGDILAKYLRNCTAQTEKNIIVNEAIMHSKVTAGEKVTVQGSKGLIVGGLVVAGTEIMAKVFGSNFATLTELEVGTKPQAREEMIALMEKIHLVEQNIDKTKKGIAFLKELATKTPGGLPAEKKEMQAKLTRSYFGLVAEQKPLQEQLVSLQKEEEEAKATTKKGRITVQGLMNTGVKVTIQKASRTVNEELKFCTITEDNGEIKIGPYKGA